MTAAIPTIVRLKSGGPKMTTVPPHPNEESLLGGLLVTCVWFDVTHNVQKSNFLLSMLDKAGHD